MCTRMFTKTVALMGSLIFALVALPLSAASIQTIKPEETGLSSERLQRIHETVQRHIDQHDISGAVTVVARKGRLAHLEAHGLMDIDTKNPTPALLLTQEEHETLQNLARAFPECPTENPN